MLYYFKFLLNHVQLHLFFAVYSAYSNKILMHLKEYINLKPPYGRLLEFK